ncbi:MAG: hypothetical protein LC732_07420, partial [Acidobacteria bacterium]|nr:hypothetical protein [Acidobacteriota bacterium]
MRAARLLGILCLLGVSFVAGEPLPISPAERQACEIVAAYLREGPPAVYGALTPDAPLRSIRRTDALEEIRARLGPPAGAAWNLRSGRPPADQPERAVFSVVWPSQIDDVITFEMVQNEGVWRIHGLRSLAELEGPRRTAVPVSATRGFTDGAERRGRSRLWFLIAALLAPALSAVGAVIRRRRPYLASGLLLSALAVFAFQIAQPFLALRPAGSVRPSVSSPGDSSPGDSSPEFLAMRSLAPLRHALATGDESVPMPKGLDEELDETAKLWLAQARLLTESSPEIAAGIDSLKIVGKSRLAELLRARIASERGDERVALAKYGLAAPDPAPHDAFWFEETSVVGFDKAAAALAKWENRGSRDAEVYYLLSSGEVVANRLPKASEQFRRAWRVQPLPREDVVAAGIFAELLRDPAIAAIVSLKTPEEWKGADLHLGRDSIRIPEGGAALASGSFLLITVGDAELSIPGGAAIAPASTKIVGASEWRHRSHQTALARLPLTGTISRRPVPAVQQQVALAIEALSAQSRWNRILDLTEWITPESERVSPSLLLSRMEAMIQTRRLDEARQLARGPVAARSAQHGSGGELLAAMGDLLLTTGEFDPALELYKRAASTRRPPDVTHRLRQVEMRRKLASSPRTHDTTHFHIRSTTDVPPEAVAFVGRVLESELPAISNRLSTSLGSKTMVNVVGWRDFATELTGSLDVAGFYDSEIVVPFANVPGWGSAIRPVLSHELTHALLVLTTGDAAPRWYQEGVATRLQQPGVSENVFQKKSSGEILSLVALDATLAHSIDPEAIGEAYLVAHALIRYLESRWGEDVLLQLNDAFRSGSDTRMAIKAVTARSLEELDAEFRAWGAANARPFSRGRSG